MTSEQTKRFKYWQMRTIIATMVGYALFYFVRKNFSLAMPGLEADLGISKTSLGIFLTLNGLIYGFSRFANGILADRMNARWYMAVGLALCALANFAFGFGEDVSYWITGEHSGDQFGNTMILFMGVMWVVNGLLQGTGFPPCARLLTHWIPPTELATKMSVWNTSHSIGAGLVVILCGYIMGTLGTNMAGDPDAVASIAANLGVSKVTIRKDIKILESKGLLYKVHGSARPANPHVADLDVHVKDNINRDAKRRIAQRAAEMLGETDSIIMASGSTVYAFAEEIKMRMWHHLNIVTPFLRLGVLLNESENVNVVQLGGSVHKKSLSVLGEEAARELDDCICSKVFFGVDGIDPEHGITTSTIDEAKLTRRMMHAASQVIVLADSSKFGQRGFGRICALEDIDVIVTDERIPEQMISIIEEAGVDLIIVR